MTDLNIPERIAGLRGWRHVGDEWRAPHEDELAISHPYSIYGQNDPEGHDFWGIDTWDECNPENDGAQCMVLLEELMTDLNIPERIAGLRGWRLSDEGALWRGDPNDKLLAASFGFREFSNWCWVSGFDPENDWAQCGVLFGELVRARSLGAVTQSLSGYVFQKWKLQGWTDELLRTAICLAWIAMKEGEQE